MSHFEERKTAINDPEALRAAVAELASTLDGISLVERSEARGYLGAKTRGDYVIHLGRHSPYDVACVRQQDGSYAMKADLYCGHVEKALGKNFGRLKQLYGVHKATMAARKAGYIVQRRQVDGAVELSVRRPS
jgi:hypothetical protein